MARAKIITKDIEQIGGTTRVAFVRTGAETIRIDASTMLGNTTHFIGKSGQNMRTVRSFVVIQGPTTLHGFALPRPIVTMVRAFAIEFPIADAMAFADHIFPPDFDVFQSHSAIKTRKIVILPRQLAISPVAITAP